MKRLRILVIDDSKLNLDAAVAQLAGHEVVTAATYDEGLNHLEATPCGFDVALVDLLIPASGKAQGSKGQEFVGQEMPVGIFLAPLAAKAGVKYVALFTDGDHHSHPASACLDPFNPGETIPAPLVVEAAQVWLCNNRNWVAQFDPNDLSQRVSSTSVFSTQKAGAVRAKNWLSLLGRARLVSGRRT